MIDGLTNGATRLGRAEIVRLATPGNVRITCDRGLVWVTAEGRRGDYWLVAGDSVDLDRSRGVVIEAAQESAISVRRTAREPRLARWMAPWKSALATMRAA